MSSRAVLYARVSTPGQAEKGYSLDDQIRALREYCTREGIEIIEEVRDDGYSGATLERPGLDRVRDLAAAKKIDLVLAQDRDRFGREPALLWLLQQELEAHGATMRALNERGDDSPEGALQTGILDQLARYERLKFAERSRRGKRAKARKGKVLPGRYAPFGYRYDPEAATFRVDPATMPYARRIFEMVGPEGETMTAAASAMQKASVPNRSGKPTWYVSTIRGIIDSDVYLTRPFAEVKEIVGPEAQLDPDKRYGILWANRVSAKRLHTGTKKFAKITNDRSEWVPTPVEDSGIPPEWVLKARENAANGAGRWGAKPSGRVLKGRFFCTCGRRMVVTSAGRGYPYYACPRGRLSTEDSSLHAGYHHAEKTEARVRDFALRLARNPELLRAPVMEDVERERRRLSGAQAQIAVIHDRLEALDAQRRKAQNLHLADERLMSRAELAQRLEEIESERATLGAERERLSHAGAELERLEESVKLLDGYIRDMGWLMEKGLVSPAELYDKLNLRIVAHREKRPDSLRRLEAYLGPTRVNEIGAPQADEPLPSPDKWPPLPNGPLTNLRRPARARWRSGR